MSALNVAKNVLRNVGARVTPGDYGSGALTNTLGSSSERIFNDNMRTAIKALRAQGEAAKINTEVTARNNIFQAFNQTTRGMQV